MAGNFIQINVKVNESAKGASGVKIRKISESKAQDSNKDKETIEKIRDALNFNPVDKAQNWFTELGTKSKSTGGKVGYTAAAIGIDAAAELVGTGIDSITAAATMRNKYGGNSAKANAASNTVSAISEVTGGVMSVVSTAGAGAAIGAQIGSAGGPWGIAIGAVVGLAVTAIKIGVENAKEASELRTEILAQQLENTKKASRLGIITTNRGRTNASDYLM